MRNDEKKITMNWKIGETRRNCGGTGDVVSLRAGAKNSGGSQNGAVTLYPIFGVGMLHVCVDRQNVHFRSKCQMYEYVMVLGRNFLGL
jgi:hypothetical protein